MRASTRAPEYVAAGGAGALAVGLASVLVHLAVAGTAWHADVAVHVRLGVLAHAVWQEAPLAAIVALFAALTRSHRSALRLGGFAGILLVMVPWVISWAQFWATGQFLNRESLQLMASSPASMLAHVLDLAPAALVAAPLAVAALALAIRAIAGRAAHIRPHRAFLLGAIAVGTFGYAALVDRLAARSARADSTNLVQPSGIVRADDLVRLLRRDRAGALAHFRAGLLAEDAGPRDSKVRVEWRPRGTYRTAPLKTPYNVVLLVVESLRSDELRAYGSKLSVMPRVDSVARDAAVFVNHYAVSTHTNYSAVVPVSGQFPLRDRATHIYPDPIPYPRVLLYDLLKPLGYRTAVVSSQNEKWGGMSNFLASDRLDHFFHSETYSGPTYTPDDDLGFGRFARRYRRSGKIDDAQTITESIRWISQDAAAPFVIYINLQNSHVPYPIPDTAPTPFGPRTTSFPIRFNSFPKDSANVVRGVYRNSLHYVDAQIGRLIDYLVSAQQWDRTIFVIVGDHGQAFFEHGFAAHANELYEELLRTPLIIRAPGLLPRRFTALAQHVDIAPTVLALLGMPPHPGYQGIDLLTAARQYAYAVVQTPMANQYGIVDARSKLVVDTRAGTIVLRELDRDPAERRNAAGSRPGHCGYLRERLEVWRDANVRYYESPPLQTKFYPPVLPGDTMRAEVTLSGATC